MHFKRTWHPYPTSRTARATPIDVPGWLNWGQKQLSDALAMAAAREAGRAAQVGALEETLRSCDADHELLRETGLLNPDGTPELRWHARFDDGHDAIAIRHGIEPMRNPACREGNFVAGVGSEPRRGRWRSPKRSIWFDFVRRRVPPSSD